MYIILVYDLTENNNKIHKLCKQYLNWIQNSVFEGEITPSNFKKLKIEIKKHTNNEDSILIFYVKNKINMVKEVIGSEKNEISNFI